MKLLLLCSYFVGTRPSLLPTGTVGKALILASEPAEGAQNIFRPRLVIDALKRNKEVGQSH